MHEADDLLIRETFPGLQEPELRERLAEIGEWREVPTGKELWRIGQYIKSIPLVVRGKVKIVREDDEGNELFLYYLQPGDACALSLVCTLHDQISQVNAIAVEDSTLLSVPVSRMDELMQNRAWYRFVVQSYGARLQELLKTIDSIAFHRMDERLLSFLQKTAEATGSKTLSMTHQEIAQSLHTSREVISRLLKQMEKRELVQLSRNQIRLLPD